MNSHSLYTRDPDLSRFRFLRYNQIGHGELICWIGISMGAATGVCFVTRNPGVVKRLVVADTITSSPDSAGVPDLFVGRAEIARKEEDAIENLTETTLERWFSQQWRDSNPAEVERMRQLMRTTSRGGFIACCNALSHASFDLRPLLRNVGSSVEASSLIAGEQDANIPETMNVMRQEISAGSTGPQQEHLIIIKGAGHVPVVDGSSQFKHEVLNFLAEGSPKV
ncbi:conserved hypothetical protein [Talaromyces stipitatus ATCC 10500]|uniref:AB hydrolase-1 domain-containing protein n=1 Tax=Talaromyces stipitatus (strain ATCC 10500 / CBS 375.48 / QM 6759 / NRRL 1006) TaxID=441959 RepID=B8MM55_TALSN|nr:uncharacterized protein TSTA_098240 [Talaromyces stipitatus ATCC 10500]EED13567.1 conserved hypothetical protein [Talaromyces stipitatus ATCC 10500]